MTVTELEFLRNVSLIVDQQSPRTVQNYIVWRFIMTQVKYMPKQFRAIKQVFNEVYKGISTESSRTTACAVYARGKKPNRNHSNGCERLRMDASGCERLRVDASGCEWLRMAVNVFNFDI